MAWNVFGPGFDSRRLHHSASETTNFARTQVNIRTPASSPVWAEGRGFLIRAGVARHQRFPQVCLTNAASRLGISSVRARRQAKSSELPTHLFEPLSGAIADR